MPSACPTVQGAHGRDARIEARDFMERPIHVGDCVIYATGGTHSTLVLAKVLKVIRNASKLYHDGHRGASQCRIQVIRVQDGNERLDDPVKGNYRWGLAQAAKVSVHQLHRTLIVDEPDWVAGALAEKGIFV